MNWAQEILFDNLWYLNIILKVRQLGVTTFFCILYLDDVVFNGLDAGLIAHTLQDATKIFDSKVRYAWDNLPEAIKSEYELDANNTRELKFRRGNVESSIYVGTSLRSGTVQRLHCSEMSTLDQKYPARSEEIKSGAFNTVHRGQIITVESTAKIQSGLFYDLCQVGEEMITSGRKLTEMDWKFFFLPWWRHPQYRLKGDIIIPIELQKYFNSLEVALKIELDQEQRNWYFKKSQTQKGAMKSEFPSTSKEAFEASVEGAYFSGQMEKVMKENRIRRVPYEPTIPVDTWWDLGTTKVRKDSTSIIFTQDVGIEIHLIDFYGNCGEGLHHYFNKLQEKGYVYGKHYAPHDIEVRELGTGKTRKETAAKLGLHFETIPAMGFSDSIEAARIVFSKCWFDEEKTDSLTKALRSFRKAWDDKLGRYKDEPLKDWSCIVGDTKVRTLKGWKKIKDVSVRDYVWGYSLKEHRLTPTRIGRVGKTKKNAELVEVLLDNGSRIKCTPEHLFMKRDETYVKAIDLENSDSLMPFYENKKQKHKGYNQIYLNDGTYAEEHRFVYSRFNQLLRDFEKGYIIHHKDENKKNNTPENLVQWTKKKHMKYHMSKPEWIKKREGFWEIAKAKQSEKVNHKCLECGQEFSAIRVAKYCRKICKDRYCSRIRRRKLGVKPRKFKNKNHKVVGVKVLNERQDVYDLYAPEISNFVAEGVIIHNSDPSDAFRLMAVGHKDHQRLGYYDPEIEELKRIKEREQSGDIDPLNPFGL